VVGEDDDEHGEASAGDCCPEDDAAQQDAAHQRPVARPVFRRQDNRLPWPWMLLGRTRHHRQGNLTAASATLALAAAHQGDGVGRGESKRASSG
jgi:hypothetical protein